MHKDLANTLTERRVSRGLRLAQSTWLLIEAAQVKAGDQNLNDAAERLLKKAAQEELAA